MEVEMIMEVFDVKNVYPSDAKGNPTNNEATATHTAILVMAQFDDYGMQRSTGSDQMLILLPRAKSGRACTGTFLLADAIREE